MGEGDLGDYIDPSVKYVPLEPIQNNMNDIDPAILSKYLDPEFIDAKPDDKAKEMEQLELEAKERMDIDFDLDDELEEDLENEQLIAARLQPREYQYELFTKALEENVIAVLDTGSGKTLISIMLIKQMVLNERQERLTRREVCIVDPRIQDHSFTIYRRQNLLFSWLIVCLLCFNKPASLEPIATSI